MDFYDVQECPYTLIRIKRTGWLEHKYLEKEEFTECYISEFENLEGIESIRYYPCQNFIDTKGKNMEKLNFAIRSFILMDGIFS